MCYKIQHTSNNAQDTVYKKVSMNSSVYWASSCWLRDETLEPSDTFGIPHSFILKLLTLVLFMFSFCEWQIQAVLCGYGND